MDTSLAGDQDAVVIGPMERRRDQIVGVRSLAA